MFKKMRAETEYTINMLQLLEFSKIAVKINKKEFVTLEDAEGGFFEIGFCKKNFFSEYKILLGKKSKKMYIV